jgi:ketosteroid isomerase-like protein
MNRDDEALLQDAYAAYNKQDADALLEVLADDVDWPDAGGRLHGKQAVRAYWLEQWTRTRTQDEPLGYAGRPDGRVVVRIRQIVRSLDGRPISAGHFDHIHLIANGRIRRLDIEAPNPTLRTP